MTGGWVTSDRYLAPTRGQGLVETVLDFGGGSSTTIGNPTDRRVYQKTRSFRTSKGEDVPDFETAQGLLDYFLRQGVEHGTFDRGHDFWTEKRWNTYSHENVSIRSPFSTLSWKGTLIPDGFNPHESIDIPVLESAYYGNKAFSTVAPTASKANAAQTLAEILREGFTMPGISLFAWLESRAHFYRSLGKEYLNVTFGWKPFLNDLYKILRVVKHMNDLIVQFDRDSGNRVRRRFDFPRNEDTSIEDLGTGFSCNLGEGSNIAGNPSLYFALGKNTGKLTKLTRTTESIWFEGAFTYYLNPGKDFLGKIQRWEQLMNQLTGSRITPAVLWELTPWSWLIDWFIDVQSVLQTFSLRSNDSLVALYQALMRTTVITETYELSGIEFLDGPNASSIGASRTVVRKERVMGTPFGFGIDPSGITPSKLAILVALAISKGPKTLPKFPRYGEPTD